MREHEISWSSAGKTLSLGLIEKTLKHIAGIVKVIKIPPYLDQMFRIAF
jgi:hypothetical protein